jgi:hypothetical protein
MKFIFISIFLFCSITIFSQNFGRIYIELPQKSAERFFDKQIQKGQKKRNITFSAKSIVGDTLIYNIQDSVECFSIKMGFSSENQTNTTKLCDYQEILFECPRCAKNHLKEIIKMNNFRQKSENSYLSSYFYSTEMTIQYDSIKMNPIRLIFRPVDLPKKEYKNLYKKLKKKNAAD